MKTRILLSSLAVTLAGLGSTAFTDSPQLQTKLALARAQKTQATINCPPTPDCPVPCTIPGAIENAGEKRRLPAVPRLSGRYEGEPRGQAEQTPAVPGVPALLNAA